MSLNIFTWNIYWKAMSGASNGLPNELGFKCSITTKENHISTPKGGGPTICLNNVVNILDTLDNIDFIALQESKHWKFIYNKLKNKNLRYVHHKYKYVDMVTFYNYKKIKIIAIKCGILNNYSDDIRPYHIIFCYDNNNNKYIIFINLHNGHIYNGFNKLNLETNLSNNIDKIMLIDKYNLDKNFENCQDYLNKKFKTIQKNFNENTYTIVVGDFNDNYGQNYYKGLKPFSKTLYSINLINVTTNNKKPPYTCCDDNPLQKKNPYNTINYLSYGDYILFSNNFDPIINNNIYNLNKLKLYSDHLPVQSILLYKIIPSITDIDLLQKPIFKLKTVNSIKLILNFDLLHYGHIINYDDELIYPINDLDNDDLILIKTNNNIIGYIQKKYLTKTINPDIFIVNMTTILRYLYNLLDPYYNIYIYINGNKFLHKGPIINKGTQVKINNFSTYINNKKYTLIQKKNNKHIFGFIPTNNLQSINKYLKYLLNI